MCDPVIHKSATRDKPFSDMRWIYIEKEHHYQKICLAKIRCVPDELAEELRKDGFHWLVTHKNNHQETWLIMGMGRRKRSR